VDSITLSGLIKIELPEATLLLCDGGFVIWGGDTFFNTDPVFGSIGAIEPLSEGVGDSAPALRLTFLPASTAAAADLSQPSWQGSRVRMWIAEVNLSTNAVIGTPDLMFDGQTDSTELVIGKGKRELVMDVVSSAERLFVTPANAARRMRPASASASHGEPRGLRKHMDPVSVLAAAGSIAASPMSSCDEPRAARRRDEGDL